MQGRSRRRGRKSRGNIGSRTAGKTSGRESLSRKEAEEETTKIRENLATGRGGSENGLDLSYFKAMQMKKAWGRLCN